MKGGVVMRIIRIFCFKKATFIIVNLLIAIVFYSFSLREASADVPIKIQLVQIESRPGVTTKFILLKPEKPKFAIILFAGTHGQINLSGNPENPKIGDLEINFLVRTREKYAQRSVMVALFDMPSDKRNADRYEMFRFRTTDEHIRDMEAVVSYIKKEAKVPVWLVGTSAGTISAAYGTIQLKGKVDGVVLTSSLTSVKGFQNNYPKGILNMNLGSIDVPAFIIAHKGDNCEYSPPSGAEQIKEALKGSSRAQILVVKGGLVSRSKPCDGLSEHGFYGNESEVVEAIVKFIGGT